MSCYMFVKITCESKIPVSTCLITFEMDQVSFNHRKSSAFGACVCVLLGRACFRERDLVSSAFCVCFTDDRFSHPAAFIHLPSTHLTTFNSKIL